MKKYFILFTFLLLYSSKPAKADHTAGLDFTYKCLGGLTYELTLDFYRDCAGAQGAGCCGLTLTSNCNNVGGISCGDGPTYPVYFTYYSLICNYCKTDTFPISTMVTTEVSPICPGMKTKCNNGTLSGIQRYRYKKVITLPSQCTDWKFIFVGWARNASTTVNTPTGDDDIVLGTLNNVAAPGNSSPSFATPNVTYWCAGRSYCYFQGTTEVDGDSLVYAITQPVANFTTLNNFVYVVYNAGYSYTSPFGTGSPITFNTTTGDVCVTPGTQLITIMNVTVTEYRKGVKIGSVVRDLEFIVTASCNNDPPLVSGKGGATYSRTSDSTHVCAGSQLCFNMNGSDPNSGNLLSMSWDNSIPGATFNVSNNNSANPSAQFCWTPTIADTGQLPHVFIVSIHDNVCPYEGIKSVPFYVYVSNCNSVLPPTPALSSSDSSICENACINFTDLSTGSPTNWLWTFAGGLPTTSTDQNPQQICYLSAGNYNVTLAAANSGGNNSLTLSNLIHVVPSPPIPGISQTGNMLHCTRDISYTGYQWFDSTTLIPGAIDTFLVITHSGNYNLEVRNANNCKTAVGINVLLGLQNYLLNNSISLSPNPATNQLILHRSSLHINEAATVFVMNVLGEIMQEEKLNWSNDITINIKTLPAGIYFLQMKTESGSVVKRFVKK